MSVTKMSITKVSFTKMSGYRIKRVMAGPTTSSSSETQEVASPSGIGVVEELEDNISTLNTSISPLGITMPG